MRSPLIEAACACQLSLDAAGRSGAENMAIDAALLDRANGEGLSFLRLYRFDPPCLSLGRNEPAARYDHTELARGGLGAGPERKRILAAWVHSARRLAGDRRSRKPQTTSRKDGNHAFRGAGATREVGRGSRGGRAGVA